MANFTSRYQLLFEPSLPIAEALYTVMLILFATAVSVNATLLLLQVNNIQLLYYYNGYNLSLSFDYHSFTT